MRTVVLALVLLVTIPVLAQQLYKWTDDEGNLHVATLLSDVPQKYRNQIETVEPVESTPTKPAPSSEPAADAPAVDDDGLIRFEVPYRHEGSARRVIIPVTFNDRITAPMALDTGSPGMIISVSLAERLGIFSRDSGTLLTEAAGIGGSALAVRTIVDTVSVREARDTFVPTTVTAKISEKFDGLIGMDFLANYAISIDSTRKVVEFRQTPPVPGARGGHDEAWWRQTFDDFRRVRDVWIELAETTNLLPDSKYRAVIEFQAREAERLYKRLDMYASDNAVPRHWR